MLNFLSYHDSCAFEHVFIGEKNEVVGATGCHNWIQYFLLEKRKIVDYYGFIASKCVVLLIASYKNFLNVSL